MLPPLDMITHFCRLICCMLVAICLIAEVWRCCPQSMLQMCQFRQCIMYKGVCYHGLTQWHCAWPYLALPQLHFRHACAAESGNTQLKGSMRATHTRLLYAWCCLSIRSRLTSLGSTATPHASCRSLTTPARLARFIVM